MSRRASTVGRPRVRPAASDKGRSRVGDSTRPVAMERRITTGKRTTLLLGLAALAIAGALAVALFVLPVRNYFSQTETLQKRGDQLARLEAVNADLEAEVARLRTADGVQEAAREEIGYVRAGEQRTSVVDAGVVPTIGSPQWPVGWPYSVVASVADLRRSQATP